MSYLFKGINGLNQINPDLIYAVARKSMSIETNFDIVLPVQRSKPKKFKGAEDAIIITTSFNNKR